MKAIIKWLIEIERMSRDLYDRSSVCFDDPAVKRFLEHSSKDEERHYRTMERALQTIDKHPELISEVSLDGSTKKAIEQAFRRSREKLDDGSLTINSLIDCIVETEFSEWNDIFLYVVNALKKVEPDFRPAAAEIQHHLRHIEHFLESQSYGKAKVDIVKNLMPVWEENILVVDDQPAILELMASILKNEGYVATAENGQIGFDMIRQRYYRLILSDVDMPVMNGLDLFRRASSQFPDIHRRFIFITGNPDPDVIGFFKRHQIKYLIKPFGFRQLRDLVLETIHRIRLEN